MKLFSFIILVAFKFGIMDLNCQIKVIAKISAYTIIDAACSLLKKQLPDYDGGLQTALLQQRRRALSKSSNVMQVIHVHERRY